VLDQLFGPAVQKTDMRVHALHDLTVELQYQTQHAVSRRVLGPEIEGEIAQGGFGHNGLASAAGSTLAADAGSRSYRVLEDDAQCLLVIILPVVRSAFT
jgi:hypothetical protein